MYFFILALLLIGCGDTVENYYAAAPIESADAATTTPDASPDAAADSSAPEASKPDTSQPDAALPDVAVDAAHDTWVEPDTYVAPDTAQIVDASPVDAGPVAVLPCTDRFVVIDEGVTDGGYKMGTGRFVDTKTGYTWTRNLQGWTTMIKARDMCKTIGMRLPFKEEILELVGAPLCAVPWSQWSSWSGSMVSGSTYYMVWHDGTLFKKDMNESWPSFCVSLK